jgi:hypothetical protein
LESLLAALIAVKVFLNGAVGLIGKLDAVLWIVSSVCQESRFLESK